MVPLIDHKETGGVALDQSDEGGLAWKVVECICGCVVGALFGLVVGWIVPGLCIVMYFHYLRQQGDQAGLILLLTSPLGAVIGGVTGLRLRRWWGRGICALVGLGPATVLLFIAPTVFLASLFVVPFGFLLLKRAWERLEQRKHAGAKGAAMHPKPAGQAEPSIGPGDLFGEYENWKQQQKQLHVRRGEEDHKRP